MDKLDREDSIGLQYYFVFGKLVYLNSFERSFLLFVAFDIMLARHAYYLTRTCDFFIHNFCINKMN